MTPKGKSCSMFGCHITQHLHSNKSFFRFPRNLSRAKEWLVICGRPDLLRRIDSGDVNITNHYVCEAHFPNQIIKYRHKNVLTKMAKPMGIGEMKQMLRQDVNEESLMTTYQQGTANDVSTKQESSDVESTNGNSAKKRKSDDTIGDGRNHVRDSQDSVQKKRKRMKTCMNALIGAAQSSHSDTHSIDENWWKNYFQQKLQLHRMRVDKEDRRHIDHMNFLKMAIMLQERMEKIKIEAINNLTSALQVLQEQPQNQDVNKTL